jgi:hypothetical protein
MSAAWSDPEVLAEAAQNFSLGLARAPLPPALSPSGDPKAALRVMALSGQALRFRRPGLPAAFDPVSTIPDPRCIVPDAARGILRELDFSQMGAMDLAIVDRLQARGWRLHPFDLPRLSAFVKSHAERLGPDALAFASGTDTEDVQGVDYFAETLDETNWMNSTPARKADYIRKQRLADPASARILVEAAFKAQNANARLRILEAFRIGLSSEDLPFLESLAGDRAPTVKQLAADLAARIPGTASFEARIADLFSRLKLGTSGFLRKKTTITIEYPANIHAHNRRDWAVSALGSVPLDVFERRLGLTLPALVEASADLPDLKTALVRRAMVEGRFSLLEQIHSNGDEFWHALYSGDADDFAALTTPQGAEAFIAAGIKPKNWPELPRQAAAARLYTLLRRPLTLAASTELLSHRDWLRPMDTEHLALARTRLAAEVVPLIHPEARPQLRRILEALEAPGNRQGLQFLVLHDLLDSA